MNTNRCVSVICEYNPFHFGHLYQLDFLKQRFEGIVCIMSGDIVQRGSIAVAGKYLRAEAALRSGANLVLELPIPWCCSSARDFAAAGVHIADSIGTDNLAFGAEDDLETLSSIKKVTDGADFKNALKAKLAENRNFSYPQAFTALLNEVLGESAAEIIKKPNNILALEYLSALENTSVLPFAVKRNFGYESSSQIRALSDAEKILSHLPDESKKVFASAIGGDFIRDSKKLSPFFIGNLRKIAQNGVAPKNIYSSTDDLIKKILAASLKYNTVDELVDACADKGYTAARVRRAVNALVFDITADRVQKMPAYTCVLAADSKGREILRNAKQLKKIDIITKPVHAVSMGEETKNAFGFAKGIEDIVGLSAPNPVSADCGKTPKIV